METTTTGQDVIFTIKQALVYEEIKGTFELGSLDLGFYNNMTIKIKSLNGEELKTANSFLNKLLNKRASKIVRLASLTPLSNITDIKLTTDEKELYNTINKSCSEFKNMVTKSV